MKLKRFVPAVWAACLLTLLATHASAIFMSSHPAPPDPADERPYEGLSADDVAGIAIIRDPRFNIHNGGPDADAVPILRDREIIARVVEDLRQLRDTGRHTEGGIYTCRAVQLRLYRDGGDRDSHKDIHIPADPSQLYQIPADPIAYAAFYGLLCQIQREMYWTDLPNLDRFSVDAQDTGAARPFVIFNREQYKQLDPAKASDAAQIETFLQLAKGYGRVRCIGDIYREEKGWFPQTGDLTIAFGGKGSSETGLVYFDPFYSLASGGSGGRDPHDDKFYISIEGEKCYLCYKGFLYEADPEWGRGIAAFYDALDAPARFDSECPWYRPPSAITYY